MMGDTQVMMIFEILHPSTDMIDPVVMIPRMKYHPSDHKEKNEIMGIMKPSAIENQPQILCMMVFVRSPTEAVSSGEMLKILLFPTREERYV